jgi:hypothetical protein
MPAEENGLGNALSPFVPFCALETLDEHKAADLAVARSRQPELGRERAHASIDFGHRLAQVVEDGERCDQPTIDSRCCPNHPRMIVAQASPV